MDRDTIVILDFGSQYTQLIARRLRELQVYSEILPPRTTVAALRARAPRGIVLSGGPDSVYADGPPRLERGLLRGGGGGRGARRRGRRARALRALRGRRFRGGGPRGAPRHRREAHLRLRGQRAAAQGRGGSGPQAVRGEAPPPRRVRRRLAPLPRQAQRGGRPGAQAEGHRTRVHRGLLPHRRHAGQAALPGAGHALSGRHRVHLGARALGRDQEPPQRGRPAEEAEVQARRAPARAVQGRGAGGGAAARPRRGVRLPPALPGAGPGRALPRSPGPRAARAAAGGGRHRGARDQGRRPLPPALAVLRRAPARPLRGRDGRRPHLPVHRGRARGGVGGRHDRGLGAPSARPPGPHLEPHRERDPRDQPRGLRRLQQASLHHRMGVRPGPPAAPTGPPVRLGRLAAALFLALVVLAGWRLTWFLTDDAFITFRYISNRRLGYGYVWNAPPFRPVEGYTNFLWMVLLDGVWSLAGVAPPVASTVLSLLFGYLTLLECARILRHLSLPPWLEPPRGALAFP